MRADDVVWSQSVRNVDPGEGSQSREERMRRIRRLEASERAMMFIRSVELKTASTAQIYFSEVAHLMASASTNGLQVLLLFHCRLLGPTKSSPGRLLHITQSQDRTRAFLVRFLPYLLLIV